MALADHIDIGNFRYELPETRIARYPLPDRDKSMLLTYDRGNIAHDEFSKLPQYLPDRSRMVFNNTRVIQARLQFKKPTGARIEVFCLEPIDPVDFQQSFESTRSCLWKCLVGNAKKWKSGPVTLETRIAGESLLLKADNTGRSGDSYLINFQWNDPRFSFGEIIESSGSTPIPPYLNRSAEDSDRVRYQTIYSRLNGSVAAPTAGLHFTKDMMELLYLKGLRTEELTLHVGAGTFVPVKAQNARMHSMHSEKVHVPRTFLERWIRQPEGLIAVGTTSTRSLESLYWLGVKLIKDRVTDPGSLEIIQWDNEKLPDHIPLSESLEALIRFCGKHHLDELQFGTQLMIVPGYRFRTIRGLITNFHLPGSTLLLLIAALIGEDWKRVYSYALENRFRFLSYGDSSLLLPKR
ncbi:MAG: S-adenosylmethionine:tRNA ribosyltransferase-isomerase [Bacteroidota bacterium]